MSEHINQQSEVANVPAPPPDDQNPAIIFARKTFWSTTIGAVLFVAAVVLFIL